MISGKYEILGVTFDVIERALDSNDVAGISDDAGRTILISSELPADTRVETFYHEVAHMWLKLSGLSHMLTEQQDEAVAQLVGFALSQFISCNESMPIIQGATK